MIKKTIVYGRIVIKLHEARKYEITRVTCIFRCNNRHYRSSP